MRAEGQEVIITRKVFFSSGWKDNSSESSLGHGYNFELEASVQGPLNPVSGLVINLTDLDRILKTVIEPFDHRHLMFETDIFKHRPISLLSFAQYCLEQLNKEFARSFPQSQTRVQGLVLKRGAFEWVECKNQMENPSITVDRR